MLAQMVRSHESIETYRAYELLLTGVRAKVTRELIGSRERLVARLPFADIGPLARMNAYVGFQVRALEISLKNK